jgi:hypothetical protein
MSVDVFKPRVAAVPRHMSRASAAGDVAPWARNWSSRSVQVSALESSLRVTLPFTNLWLGIDIISTHAAL